jgi:riboflavin kinase/FMN adenylyltransferase
MDYTTTLTTGTTQPIAITIGNFDGIHRGHQYLMHELRLTAASLQSIPVMVTFEPHTLMVVRPDIDVRLLTTTVEKLALAKRYAQIDESLVIHFTREVAQMNAADFLDTLRARFPVSALVVGDNFSLGNKRMGDVAFLTTYAQQHAMVFRAISLTEENQVRISSTRIRTLVSDGDIVQANELLGHPVLLAGMVTHGDERGRLIGFPTANLEPELHRLLPANGVYAVRVYVHQQKPSLERTLYSRSDYTSNIPVYNGVANIGIRPTFDGVERRVEVHLLDTSLDLYEKYLSVEVLARLRGEQRFAGVDALKAQIAADIVQARSMF